MFKVHLVMVSLIVMTIIHGFVFIGALLHFMWLEAFLAGTTTTVGVWFIDQLDREFYQEEA